MKKNVLIGLVVLLWITGCRLPGPEKKEDTPLEHETEARLHKVSSDDLEILEIDGCEYFVYKDHLGANMGFGFMAHKGNCKNPVHCYNNQDSLRTQ